METEQRHDHHDEDHDRGLSFDLPMIVNRRRALTLLGGAGLATIVAACGSSDSGSAATGSSTTSTSTTIAGATAASGSDGTAIPEETAGPYPGDGSNGPDVLTQSGIVRRDITTSFGSLSGTAGGVPLTIELTVVDTKNGMKAVEGAAVYVWHATREGGYSLYSQGVTDQNYLRGVQVAGSDGTVSFDSIYPACYDGRWPHIHFEVYQDVATATAAGSKLATSQVALPEDTCSAVYATDGYEASIQNLQRVSLDTDMVFRDGWSKELGTVTGSVTDGLTVKLTVPV
jgi:protocatechuate 3,4-dioxygenase beta subunit